MTRLRDLLRGLPLSNAASAGDGAASAPQAQQSAIRNPRSEIEESRTPAADGIRATLPELLALRGEGGRLDLAPRGKVLATLSGGHLSRFRGRGMEFDESRVYQAGDDVRNMDWRVTARAGTPHVKLFREERERPVWLVVDLGPTMRFGTRVAFKSVVAARAAALLAWAAAGRGDRVGGLVLDGARRVECRPAPRTRGVLPLLRALAELSGSFAPQDPAPDPAPAPAGPGAAFHPPVRPGSLVFLISDFAALPGAGDPWLAELAARNEVVLIAVYDPIEAAAPPPGLYPVTDGARRGLLDTAETARRRAWERHFAERVESLEDLAVRHRIHLLRLRTDEPVGPALARGLNPRRRRVL